MSKSIFRLFFICQVFRENNFVNHFNVILLKQFFNLFSVVMPVLLSCNHSETCRKTHDNRADGARAKNRYKFIAHVTRGVFRFFAIKINNLQACKFIYKKD